MQLDSLWRTDHMMRSGYDCLKSHVLRCWWNDVNNWADVISSGRVFQMRGAATGKARLPTVDSLTEGTIRRLVSAERSVHRPCRSATGTSGPRYRGALPCKTLYGSTATLYSVHCEARSQWITTTTRWVAMWEFCFVGSCQMYTGAYLFCCCHCLLLELLEEFDETLKRNGDAVEEGFNNLSAQIPPSYVLDPAGSWLT